VAFAAFGVVGGDGFFATVVDAEAGMFPRKEVGGFFGADEFGVAEGFSGGVEEVGEQVAALAKDAAQDAGDGEDELAVTKILLARVSVKRR